MAVRGATTKIGSFRSTALLFLSLATAGLCTGVDAVGPVHSPSDRPLIVAFGDSLTAGLGVAEEDSYPSQLQRRLDREGFQYRVINAGVTGDTTAGGLRRIDWALKSRPHIVILELGANDGLRGLSLRETKSNLERIIQQCRNASATVILASMKLPPNYGVEYTNDFESMYPALARKYQVVLLPFFLDGVAGSSSLNQADGIHPTGEGYRIIVEKVLEKVRPLLRRAK